METEGAHCFAAARQAGQLVELPGITSVATSLGALSVSQTLFNLAMEKVRKTLNLTRSVHYFYKLKGVFTTFINGVC